MYVHPELGVAYIAHYRVASRATARVLLARGFERWLGHHGVPWKWEDDARSRASSYWPQIFQLLRGPPDLQYYATHRNHFDLFLSRITVETMYIHHGLKLVYVAHPRTASRETAAILKSRGFVKTFGHHGVPWGPGYLRDAGPAPQTGDIWWWWNEAQNEYAYYATHRNHFDTFLSIMAVKGSDKVEALRWYLWQHAAHYRCSRVLFPAFQELNGCRPLRFESLREDLNLMLTEHHLRPLQPDEFIREESNTYTAGRPRDSYRNHINPELRKYIETSYETEMARFGYEW